MEREIQNINEAKIFVIIYIFFFNSSLFPVQTARQKYRTTKPDRFLNFQKKGKDIQLILLHIK